MQKNFAIAKISEGGGGEKEVSGALCPSRRGRMRGAHRLPTFWGRGGGGRQRLSRRRVRRDCDFLKFAVCCDNNDLEGRNFSARARSLDGLGKRGPKRNERRQAEAKHVYAHGKKRPQPYWGMILAIRRESKSSLVPSVV